MVDYVTLLGAEQVQNAANTIRSAADDMSRAASTMSEAASNMITAANMLDITCRDATLVIQTLQSLQVSQVPDGDLIHAETPTQRQQCWDCENLGHLDAFNDEVTRHVCRHPYVMAKWAHWASRTLEPKNTQDLPDTAPKWCPLPENN